MSVVQAVIKSTERYVEHLKTQTAAETHYDVEGITLLEASELVDGEIQKRYSCSIRPYLTLRPGTGALITLEGAPDDRYGIQLLSYNRKEGVLEFSSSSDLDGERGRIVISFLWLVERALEWYQANGNSIPRMLCSNNVSPFDGMGEGPEGASDEQNEAIECVLTRQFSYVWGPPGTGKTNWVLASAVRACVECGEVVLVVASTNLAVDNALAALLETGVSENKVLRVGIPGYQFRDQYPRCCEANVFRGEIAALREQIDTLAGEIEVLSYREDYEAAAKRIPHLRRDIEDLKAESVGLIENREEIAVSLTEIEQSGLALKAEVENLKEQRSLLKYEEARDAVTELEKDQQDSIRERNRIKSEISRLNWFQRTLFTGKQGELHGELHGVSRHLASVETTLEKKREEETGLRGQYEQLSGDISSRQVEVEGKRQKWKDYNEESHDLSQRIDSIGEQELLKKKELEQLEQKARRLVDFQNQYPSGGDQLLEELKGRLNLLEEELRAFEADLSSRSILGMTLDGFIGMTLGATFHFDRVFLDEGPYAPLAKVLPLLSLGCPIAVLGDHKQLPPVCPVKNDSMIRSFWAKPSIFMEESFEIFHIDGQDSYDELEAVSDPAFSLFARCDLTRSYRFGESLADLLDEHIYRMGMRGASEADTQIRCVHCEPLEEEGRKNFQNPSEADAIIDVLAEVAEGFQSAIPESTIAVLTPYKKQASLIRQKVKARFGHEGIGAVVEVLNTHQAQGREWDWVFFSVSDTGRLTGNGPFLADTSKEEGRPLINTTLSRAKSQLWVFLDKTYWRDPERFPDNLHARDRGRISSISSSLMAEIARRF